MRVIIPEFATKAQTFDYLRANKADLIQKKCALPIKSEPFACTLNASEAIIRTKSEGEGINPDEAEVTFIGNTAMYMDSAMDVLTPDSFTKTVNERGPIGKNIIAHLADHEHSVGAILGSFVDMGVRQFPGSELGLPSVLSASALVAKSLIKRKYNQKVFSLYMDGLIKQHSIGLQYVKIALAMNSITGGDEQEKALYDKYIDQIINRDEAEQKGYFWIVSEIKLYEISAVLFGANPITPTLEVTQEPGETTPKSEIIEPVETTQENKEIDFSKLSTIKFI